MICPIFVNININININIINLYFFFNNTLFELILTDFKTNNKKPGFVAGL